MPEDVPVFYTRAQLREMGQLDDDDEEVYWYYYDWVFLYMCFMNDFKY